MTQNDVGDATGRNAEHLHAQEDLIHGNSDENHGLWTRDPRSVQADTAASLLVPLFVGSSAAMLAISVLSIGIFSAFMLYDIKRIIDGGETNYISATLALYMNAINIFQSLLVLLGVMGGDKE